MSHKIIPFIRCTDNAKEVAEYYCDIFPGSSISKENPVVLTFDVFGQSLATLNGGPHENPNPSISFSLWIKDQALTQQIWDRLSSWGKVLMEYGAYDRSKAYGWCDDKYGVSRQVMYDERPEHTTNAMLPSLMYTQHMAGKAEEAMNFYTSIFPASTIESLFRYGPGEQDVEWTIAHGEFRLVNQLFIAMDSSLGHKFFFNDGISLMVSCKDQEEVDHYRNKLALDGGQEVQCGRCKDKYGVSRQIVPLALPQALFNPDQTAANYARDQMMKMKKIVIADLYQKSS